MNLADFENSLAADAPPEGWTAPLAALWWAERNQWDRAHALVQDASGPEAAWVHGHLHRVEGDLTNAGYWYRRAGRPMSTCPGSEERRVIASTLLGV